MIDKECSFPFSSPASVSPSWLTGMKFSSEMSPHLIIIAWSIWKLENLFHQIKVKVELSVGGWWRPAHWGKPGGWRRKSICCVGLQPLDPPSAHSPGDHHHHHGLSGHDDYHDVSHLWKCHVWFSVMNLGEARHQKNCFFGCPSFFLIRKVFTTHSENSQFFMIKPFWE